MRIRRAPPVPSALLLALAALLSGCHPVPQAKLPPPAAARVVCLGDSITDGCTYPQILLQALKEAGRPVPTIVCAGVASDTAPQMAARLERSVLCFEPDIVTFSAGTNDSLRGVAPAAYETALREIAGKVKAQGATMILLTPCIITPRTGGGEAARQAASKRAEAAGKLTEEYARAIRRVAGEERWPVAENNALMQAARRQGKEIMTADGIHPNYAGQSLIARAILDAMGHRDVALPREFSPRLFPGVVREWKMRLAPLDEKRQPQRLAERSVGQLQPDETWKTYALPDPAPEARPTAEDWWEQERRNGFGLKVHERIGKGLVQAVATVHADQPAKAWVSIGIGIDTVWLNGKKLHEQGKAWTGFHAGKDRLPVQLEAGRNTLAVEINGPQFFLSVTDKLVWEEDLR
jgi:lysophospholipase L1-like esterase